MIQERGIKKGKKCFCRLPVLECHLLFYWTFWGYLKIGLPFPVKTSHLKNIKLFLYKKKQYSKKIDMKSSNPRLTQSYVMMCLFMRSLCLLKWEKKIKWKGQMSQSAYTGVFSAFLFWFFCIFTVTVCFLDLKKRELHWKRHTHGRKWTDEKQKNKFDSTVSGDFSFWVFQKIPAISPPFSWTKTDGSTCSWEKRNKNGTTALWEFSVHEFITGANV